VSAGLCSGGCGGLEGRCLAASVALRRPVWLGEGRGGGQMREELGEREWDEKEWEGERTGAGVWGAWGPPVSGRVGLSSLAKFDSGFAGGQGWGVVFVWVRQCRDGQTGLTNNKISAEMGYSELGRSTKHTQSLDLGLYATQLNHSEGQRHVGPINPDNRASWLAPHTWSIKHGPKLHNLPSNAVKHCSSLTTC
jgi:hypothetical protein